jgi:hypothetical protein
VNHDVENANVVFDFYDACAFAFEGTCLGLLLGNELFELLIELFHRLSFDVNLVDIGNLAEILWGQIRDINLLLLIFILI